LNLHTKPESQKKLNIPYKVKRILFNWISYRQAPILSETQLKLRNS